MANLIPHSIGSNSHSSAERRLADRLRAELDDRWVVMHSVGLVSHRTKRWAEADFVVVGPGGIYCLEVKGGRVSRAHGVWTFNHRNGHSDRSPSGPFDQAGGAAGALQHYLADSHSLRWDGTRYQVGYGVVIPDVELDAHGPDIGQSVLLDARDWNAPLAEYFDRLATHWESRLGPVRLGQDDIARIAALIRPNFEARLTRATGVKRSLAEMARATEEQQRILDSLADNQRIRVLGPAGTGKSFLAAAGAQQLTQTGRRVLLICRSTALADRLQSAAPDTQVLTMTSLQTRLIKRAGRWHELPESSFSDIAQRFLPPLAVECAPARPEFDAVVIDESQDLTTLDPLRLLDKILIGGLHDGTWHAYSDPNQAIFDPPAPEASQLLRSARPAVFRLNRNVRNTRQIVEWNSILSGCDDTGSTDVQGPDVSILQEAEIRVDEYVAAEISNAISAGINDDNIVVLTHNKRDRDGLIEALDGELTADTSLPGVRCSTIAAFKGLEATAVVLVAPSDLDQQHHRQAAYVAASRARVMLSIIVKEAGRDALDRRVSDYALRRAHAASGGAAATT
jgi:hypothetical protein